VTQAVIELRDKGLLEDRPLAGVSRRDALRKFAGVGIAAASAPLIVSALAPTPADAFSGPTCRPLNATCTSATEGGNGDCCGATTICTNGGNGVAQRYCKPQGTVCTPGGSKPGGVNCTNSGNNHVANAQCCSGFCGNGSNTVNCAA
jgi:hypothetical protein